MKQTCIWLKFFKLSLAEKKFKIFASIRWNHKVMKILSCSSIYRINTKNEKWHDSTVKWVYSFSRNFTIVSSGKRKYKRKTCCWTQFSGLQYNERKWEKDSLTTHDIHPENVHDPTKKEVRKEKCSLGSEGVCCEHRTKEREKRKN